MGRLRNPGSLPAGLILRRLAPADSLSELTALLHSAHGALARMGFRYWASHQPDADTAARAGAGECFVGVLDGRLVATVTLVPPGKGTGTPWYEKPGVVKVQQFAVAPELQRQGIGSAMMDLVEERAREMGASEVALDTAEGAEHLIRMYEKRGYRLVERADWRPKVNYRSVILSLALDR